TAVRAGWFSLQQTNAGTFSDTSISSMKFTLEGTAAASDISSARLFYDAGCTGTGGTQVGLHQSFAGTPPTVTFSGLSGVNVEASTTSPPERCVYIEFDIASAATAG